MEYFKIYLEKYSLSSDVNSFSKEDTHGVSIRKINVFNSITKDLITCQEFNKAQEYLEEARTILDSIPGDGLEKRTLNIQNLILKGLVKTSLKENGRGLELFKVIRY